jgi:hypothetical protein
MNHDRLLTLASTLLETPEDYFPKLIAHYEYARAYIKSPIDDAISKGAEIRDCGDLPYLLFGFSNLRHKLTTNQIVDTMIEDFGIRALPSVNIGSENFLRFSLGSVFVRPKELPEVLWDYNSDMRMDDFNREDYKDMDLTSDNRVHEYLAGALCQSITKLLVQGRSFVSLYTGNPGNGLQRVS